MALLASAAALLLSGPAAHANEVKFKSTFGAAGALGGQFNSPAGAAVNNTTGNVYVADRGNNRIQEFNAAGGFIRAWGYDVVASGDDNVTAPNEVQQIKVAASGGLYRLNFGGQSTGGYGAGDITEGSPTVTSVVTAKGFGNTSNGGSSISTWAADFGQWEVGQPIEAPGFLQPETVITSLSNFGIGISKPAVAGGTAVPLTSPGPFPFAVGQTITGPGIPAETKILAASAGELTLSNNATATTTGIPLTTGIAYNASHEELETALNALPKINAGGGAVSVTGGPGDATGSSPYAVTFGTGPLAGTNVAKLTMEDANLARPVGKQLRCEGSAPRGEPEGVFEYQWLANGQPIPGATEQTYTTVGGDAGKAIQCRLTVVFTNTLGAGQGVEVVGTAVGVSNSSSLVAPGTPAPPEGPLFSTGRFGEIGNARFFRNDPNVSSPGLNVGAPSGTIKCVAGAWGGGPTTYTYQWFREGAPFGSPTSTAATSNELLLTEEDLSTQAAYQCQVTATNSGGSTARISARITTSPSPESEVPGVTLEAANEVDPVVTTTNGGAAFEVCNAATLNDVCKAGVAGGSLGQFDHPRGVAVDNSPGGEGDVYVGDDNNFRVQKFTASGEPILTFGKNVDKSAGGKICTAASGDTCGTGIRNLDATTGTFAGWPEAFGSNTTFQEFGNTVSVDGSGDVYVTDPTPETLGFSRANFREGQHARIEKFDSNGNYIGQVLQKTGNGDNAYERPISVASDSQGKVYAPIPGEESAVYTWESPLFTPEGTVLTFVERDAFHESHEPRQVAVDPRHDSKIWITDQNSEDLCNLGATGRRALVAYDPQGHQLACESPEGPGALQSASGLAIAPSGLAYVAARGQNLVKVFELPLESVPSVSNEKVSKITTETARVQASVNPGFEPTSYVLEYGTEPCGSNTCQKVAGPEEIDSVKDIPVTLPLAGLLPGTQYHYRVVAENPLGETDGTERTFTTFPFVDLVNDKCPNALARKQTRTAGMLDCRAYELASAQFTGGYDVVSDLAPGQIPFDGYPDAKNKLLYAVQDGGIPGTGSPTNRGPDPYVAIRGAGGWTTKYVGIPSNEGFSAKPFSSTLAGADSGLDTFAFGGPEICSPCFADGSSGEPVRLPDGSLVQGMLGSTPQLGAVPSGYIASPLSADGSHFVFGSNSLFVSTGSSEGSIYDRNLSTGVTQVASTLPNGNTISGGEVGELGISSDGSHILIGQKVSIDAQGNSYWHLYMHVGSSTHSIDLTPGTANGVLYGGMSADGSIVYFATPEELISADTDTSADVYKASVGASSATLSLVSVKGASPSNSDACSPPGEPTPWNQALGSTEDCSALVLAGGAGVAADGTIYFLSPELLDGPSNGKADQPNLYVVQPGGQPQFVATIDDSTNLKLHPLPGPDLHPLITARLSGLSEPTAVAVDQSNNDLYVVERSAARLSRYDSSGAAKNFTEGPGTGTNRISITQADGAGRQAVAVDNAPGSPFNGDFYLRKNRTTVGVYAPTGLELGSLTGFSQICGLTVDQSNGTLYVGEGGAATIRRLVPISSIPPISTAKYTQTGVKYPAETGQPCRVAADSAGRVFAATSASNGEGPSGALKFFNVGEFTSAPFPTLGGEELKLKGVVPPSTDVNVDPATQDVYVDTGNSIALFDSSLNLIRNFATEELGGSRGVAVRSSDGHVFATKGTEVLEFGIEPEKYVPIDNPTVVHAADDNGTHRFSDFQTTANGLGLLSTKVPQGSYDNDGFNMVYSFDPLKDKLACASCLPTEGLPTGDASLPSHGSGITDEGSVFFNSPDQLVMRDTNGKLDAYEWKEGQVSLISTGFSTFPSSLLSVSSDGTDAFFFTRETLVPGDLNGQAMKLYDARKEGGFFVIPNSPPCAASDECHGPGSETPPPPPIGSFRGVGGQTQPLKCKKGQVKKKGKCVKKNKKNKKKKKGKRRQRAGAGQGGAR